MITAFHGRWFAYVLVWLALWLPWAVDGQTPQLKARVNDLAGVMSAQEAMRLTDLLSAYERQTTHQIAVLTVPSLEGETIEAYARIIRGAKTIIWNGPMGIFEMPPFDTGTVALAKAVAESGAVSVVGGGDSEKAIKTAGVADKITHISTGGGASLEFLAGIELPGVAVLTDKAAAAL